MPICAETLPGRSAFPAGAAVAPSRGTSVPGVVGALAGTASGSVRSVTGAIGAVAGAAAGVAGAGAFEQPDMKMVATKHNWTTTAIFSYLMSSLGALEES